MKLELKIDISGFFFFFFLAEQIRVLCGVNPEDLKQLFHVSKSIREAVSILICKSIFDFLFDCVNNGY